MGVGSTFHSAATTLLSSGRLLAILVLLSGYPIFSNGFVVTTRWTVVGNRAQPVFSSATVDHTGNSNNNNNNNNIDDLPLPPMKNGFLQRFRDLFHYLKDPDAVIRQRFAELGPIFRFYAFFTPVVVVGGQELVSEFTSDVEYRASVVYAQVPDSFVELHTKWGNLNLDIYDPIFVSSRQMFSEVLSSAEAKDSHIKAIEPEVDAYIEELARRVQQDPDQEFCLAPELKSLCLQTFAKIFTGQGLTTEQEQSYLDYNAALLALSRNSDLYRKGAAALETLKADHLSRFHEMDQYRGQLDDDKPGQFYHSKISGRPGWEDEDRIATGMVLMIWASYVEVSGLMMDSLALMAQYGKTEDDGDDDDVIRKRVLQEFEERKAENVSQNDFKFWSSLPYTIGVLRETLRLEPPGSSVPRYGNEDFALGGYRIPAKMAVQLDPRYGNNDPDLFVEPTKFEPLRWVKEKEVKDASASKCPFTGTATKLGKGAWFPASYGAHQCPGLALAELTSAMFIAKMAERFEWKFSGSGLKKDGKSIDYVTLPIRMPPDDFGLKFKVIPRQE